MGKVIDIEERKLIARKKILAELAENVGHYQTSEIVIGAGRYGKSEKEKFGVLIKQFIEMGDGSINVLGTVTIKEEDITRVICELANLSYDIREQIEDRDGKTEE